MTQEVKSNDAGSGETPAQDLKEERADRGTGWLWKPGQSPGGGGSDRKQTQAAGASGTERPQVPF